jgi:hypothetical protein|tara:strand:+ start:320 stop:562 length:243 start_codon:yes stop_codon:yes gene_type:complete
MTEQKDEIRLKQLLSVFGEDRQKEIIEILHRDQIRYHQEQLILSGVSGMFSAEKVEDAYSDGLDYGMGNGGLKFHLENYR